ncbi:MAG: ribose-phosphate pyrophosphokinase-like domain-containing protein, partial [Candidatus Omnitrophica bacterium]|nr:ribose-phosphate pyrophosphokinase-like domain-containing protein [Candidatus Omnitrophota bacterium]
VGRDLFARKLNGALNQAALHQRVIALHSDDLFQIIPIPARKSVGRDDFAGRIGASPDEIACVGDQGQHFGVDVTMLTKRGGFSVNFSEAGAQRPVNIYHMFGLKNARGTAWLMQNLNFLPPDTTPDHARSKSGLPLSEQEVDGELERSHERITGITSAEYENILQAKAIVISFLVAIGQEAWIPALEELLADQGKLRAGPFELFYGAISRGTLYLDTSILKDRFSLALTILHELGAFHGLEHAENLSLESELICFLQTQACNADDLTVVTAETGLIGVQTLRFPDGEWYLKILNPYAVKGSNVEVFHCLQTPDDLVKLILLCDALRAYDASRITVFITNNIPDENHPLIGMLARCCDTMKLRPNGSEKLLLGTPPQPFEKQHPPLWIDTVLYQHARLRGDAEDAARSIHAVARRIQIDKHSANPLDWSIVLPEGLEGTNAVLVHSMENNLDIAELWLMLISLRRAGVASISLINSYAGYSRQDKVFKAGESISALTILKVNDALIDNYFVLNIHYGKQSGFTVLPGYPYQIYNLNAFVQVAEGLFSWLEKRLDSFGPGALQKEFLLHPLFLLAPDDGAFEYVREAAQLLPAYIKDNYGLDVRVHCGYMDKVRTGPTTVTIPAYILDGRGNKVVEVGGIPVRECWVFIVDDETSSGGTLFTATYVLVRNMKFAWQRILTGVVHGKLARGLEPFKTGRSEEDISAAAVSGTAIEPSQEYVKEASGEQSGRMPPRLLASTMSVDLPASFPLAQKVSIGPLVSYAVKKIIGGNEVTALLNTPDPARTSHPLNASQAAELQEIVDRHALLLSEQPARYQDKQEHITHVLALLGLRDVAAALKDTTIIDAPEALSSEVEAFGRGYGITVYAFTVILQARARIVIVHPEEIEKTIIHDAGALSGKPHAENVDLETIAGLFMHAGEQDFAFAQSEFLLRRLRRDADFVVGEDILVARMAQLLAEEAGLPGYLQDYIYRAGLVHDLGKGHILVSWYFRSKFKAPFWLRKLMAILHAKLTVRMLKKQGITLQPWEEEVLLHHDYYNGDHEWQSPTARRLWTVLVLADQIVSYYSPRPYKKTRPRPFNYDSLVSRAASFFDPGCGICRGGKGVLPQEEIALLGAVEAAARRPAFLLIIENTLKGGQGLFVTVTKGAHRRFLEFLRTTFVEGAYVTADEIVSRMPLRMRDAFPMNVTLLVLDDMVRSGALIPLVQRDTTRYLLWNLGVFANASPIGEQIWGTPFFTGTPRGLLDILNSGHLSFLPRNVRSDFLAAEYSSLSPEEQSVVDIFIEAYIAMARTVDLTQNKYLPSEYGRGFDSVVFVDQWLSEEGLENIWKARCKATGVPAGTPMTGEFRAGFARLHEHKASVRALLSALETHFALVRQRMPFVKTYAERDALAQQFEEFLYEGLRQLLSLQYEGPVPMTAAYYPCPEDQFYGRMIAFYSRLFIMIYEPRFANHPTFVMYHEAEEWRQKIFGLGDFMQEGKQKANQAALGVFGYLYEPLARFFGWVGPVAQAPSSPNLVTAYLEGAFVDALGLLAGYQGAKQLPAVVDEVLEHYAQALGDEEATNQLPDLLVMYRLLYKLALVCAAANAMDFGDAKFQNESSAAGFDERSWLLHKMDEVIIADFAKQNADEFFEIIAMARLRLLTRQSEGGFSGDAHRPRVILLTDNAGETVIVMLLVFYLLDLGFNVTIASRDVPVINDMTRDDTARLVVALRERGYLRGYGEERLKVISSGARIFATPVATLSSDFLRDFSDEHTACVIAMGQGNAESLWQGQWKKPFVHILMAKTPEKIEEFVGIPKHSAMLLVNPPQGSLAEMVESEELLSGETVCLQDRPELIAALMALDVMIVGEQNIYLYAGEFKKLSELADCFMGGGIVLDASRGPIYLGYSSIAGEAVVHGDDGGTVIRQGSRIGTRCYIRNSIIIGSVIEDGESVVRRKVITTEQGVQRRFRRRERPAYLSREEMNHQNVAALSVNKSLLQRLRKRGVRVNGDPATIYIDEAVSVESGAVIHSNVMLLGQTVIRRNAEVGPLVNLRNCEAGNQVRLAGVRANGCIFHPYVQLEDVDPLEGEEIYLHLGAPEGAVVTGIIIDPALEKGAEGIMAVRVKREEFGKLHYSLAVGEKRRQDLTFGEIKREQNELYTMLLWQVHESLETARRLLVALREDRELSGAFSAQISSVISRVLESRVVDNLTLHQVKALVWQIISVYATSPYHLVKREADEAALQAASAIMRMLDGAEGQTAEEIASKRLAAAIKIAALSNVNVFDRLRQQDPVDQLSFAPARFNAVIDIATHEGDADTLLHFIDEAGFIAADDTQRIIVSLLSVPEPERRGKTILFNINNSGEAVYCLVLIRELLRLGYDVVTSVNPRPIDDNYDLVDLSNLLQHPLVHSDAFLGRYLDEGRIRAITNGSLNSGLDLRDVSRDFYETAISRDTTMMFCMGYAVTSDVLSEALPLNTVCLSWVKDPVALEEAGLHIARGKAAILFIPQRLSLITHAYHEGVPQDAYARWQETLGERWQSEAMRAEDLGPQTPLVHAAISASFLLERLRELASALQQRGPPGLAEKTAAALSGIGFVFTNDPYLLGVDPRTSLPYIASCNISSRVVYMHPYLSEADPNLQFEVIYHELVSHIILGLDSELDALCDTFTFMHPESDVSAAEAYALDILSAENKAEHERISGILRHAERLLEGDNGGEAFTYVEKNIFAYDLPDGSVERLFSRRFIQAFIPERNAPITPLAVYQAGAALSAMLDGFPYGYLRLKALAGYIAQAGATLDLSKVLAPWHMLSLFRATYRISGMSDTRVDALLDSLEEELKRLWQGFANECAYDELFELSVKPSEQFGTLSPRLTPVGVEFRCSPESLIASLSGVIDSQSIAALAEAFGLDKDKESVLAFIKDYARRDTGCLYLVGNLMWLKPWGEPFTAVDIGRRSFGATALHDGWAVPFASEYADGIWRWVVPCEMPAGIDAPKDVHYKFLIRIAHEGAEFDFYLPDSSVAEKAGEAGNSLVRIGKSPEFQRLAQSNAPEAGRLTLQFNLDLYTPPEGMNHIQGLSLLAPDLRGMGIRRIMLGPGTLFRGTLPYSSPYAPAALVSPYGATQDFVALGRICADL